MTATELINALSELVKTHGDLGIAVYDHESGACCATSVFLREKDGVRFLEIDHQGEWMVQDTFRQISDDDSARLVERVVKVLAKNSPFLDLAK